MSDVNDGLVIAPPGGEKAGDILLGVRIVPRSIGGVVGRIDTPLNIDN
jgi:hypothetical protein